jgi:hypothetical protein
MIADASGSIGGTVFSRNRGGAYVRNRTTPLNPQTTFQTSVRSAFANLATRYATVLTGSQRDAWQAYGEIVPVPNALGDDRFLTGIQHYIRSNSLLSLASAPVVDSPPSSFTAGPTIEPTITINATTDEFTVTNLGGYDPTASGALAAYISVGRPVNPGVGFYKSPFRQGFSGAIVTLAALPTAQALPYPVVAGQGLFVRFASATLDGRVGVPVIQRFLIT